MGFGTQQQLGNRTGITNRTGLPDFFGGGGFQQQPQPFPGGGNITPIGLGQPLDGQQFGGQQNELFMLLQQLLGGQGGFQQAPGQQLPGGPTRQPPIDLGFGQQPPVGFQPPVGQLPPIGVPGIRQPPRLPPVGITPQPRPGFGNISPPGLGRPPTNGQSLDVLPRNFGGTPLTALLNGFGNQSFR